MENFKHSKSVSSNVSESGSEVEYDKYGRMTYEKDSGGFWALKFYDEPVSDRVNHTPYQVVHKYWELYQK